LNSLIGILCKGDGIWNCSEFTRPKICAICDLPYFRCVTLKERFNPDGIEIGCDEAGRGCLAGPVVAAATVVPGGWSHPVLNDSKKLTELNRNDLRRVIEKEFEHWAVGFVFPEEIDEINILNASFLAMHRAIEKLKCKADLILVDGNRFNVFRNIPHECIIKGDGKYSAIAAASILAKTHRDEFMKNVHEDFPFYDWNRNKGYPTVKHRDAIGLHGPCIHHRKSFRLLPAQMELFSK